MKYSLISKIQIKAYFRLFCMILIISIKSKNKYFTYVFNESSLINAI